MECSPSEIKSRQRKVQKEWQDDKYGNINNNVMHSSSKSSLPSPRSKVAPVVFLKRFSENTLAQKDGLSLLNPYLYCNEERQRKAAAVFH